MTINVNAGSYGEHDYQPRNEFPDKPKPNCANLGSGAKDDPEHCNHLDYVCSFKRWPWSKKNVIKKELVNHHREVRMNTWVSRKSVAKN